jgi:imidazolonepropionase-like amidohydrolase
VLRAATCDAAALLGLERLGHLRAGAKASLLAVQRNPLEDPTALAEAALVFVDGKELRPAAGG